MRLPRVFIEQSLAPGANVALPEGQSLHLTQVLRLQAGARLVLFNGDGHDYPAHLAGQKGRPTVVVEGRGPAEPAVRLEIQLAVGVSKGERMDLVVQKAVELGCSRIMPLFTERSVVRLANERLERRMAHWRGVLIGACEQSGRRRLPQLDRAADFEAWIQGFSEGGLLLDPRGTRALVTLPRPESRVTLLVGPEGGLSPRERRQALDRGFLPVRLGPRVLRTETAPLAAIATIQALWGDFEV